MSKKGGYTINPKCFHKKQQEEIWNFCLLTNKVQELRLSATQQLWCILIHGKRWTSVQGQHLWKLVQLCQMTQQTHKTVPLAHGLLVWLNFNSHQITPKLILESIHSHSDLSMQKQPQLSKLTHGSEQFILLYGILEYFALKLFEAGRIESQRLWESFSVTLSSSLELQFF